MWSAALFVLAGGLASASGDLPEGVEALTQEASALLLEGRGLPGDIRQRLLRLDPAGRLQAIVFLRRAGLLNDRAWSLDDMLKPALPEPKETR